MAADRVRIPRHRRVANAPRMRLTARDRQVVLAVHEFRVLRTDQIQRLFFSSRNTANYRLQRLYQHGFLERRWRAVEYGQGMGQAVYLLGKLVLQRDVLAKVWYPLPVIERQGEDEYGCTSDYRGRGGPSPS